MKIPRAYPAFTIVEVIVALSLLAILVVLLTPAVVNSRESGKRAVCTQHLHQVGLETSICAQNNRVGTFPSLNMSLAPNPDGRISVMTTRRSDYASGWNYFSPDSMSCPADEQPGVVSIRNFDGSTRTMPVSFGYHIRMYYNGIGMNDFALGPPSEVAEFFDGSMSGSDSLTGKNIEGNYPSTMDFSLFAMTYRHRDHYAQCVFVDGHVKTLDAFEEAWLPFFGGGNAPVAQVMGNANGNANAASNNGTTTGTSGSTNGGANGSTNGGANGSTNGGANGSTNGGGNGSTIGGGNGSTNGGGNGSSNGATTGSTTTGSTTGSTTGATGSHDNGHGNNYSGVDSSNPGRGSGGPNGGADPSGNIDDERRGH
jgi:hypothetical protein